MLHQARRLIASAARIALLAAQPVTPTAAPTAAKSIATRTHVGVAREPPSGPPRRGGGEYRFLKGRTTGEWLRVTSRAPHFALGIMWGAAMGVAGYYGLRGARAIGTVFTTVYTGDVALNTALGLYKPSSWSKQDLIVDLVDKFVQAGATGVVYDRITPSAR